MLRGALAAAAAYLLSFFPRSSSVIQTLCGMFSVGFLSVALFSRSLGGVIIGATGALVSLETYAAVARGERASLLTFGGYMVLSAGASIGLGALTLAGVESSCTRAAAPDACQNVAIVTGVLLTAGSSSIGLFAALASWLAYAAWTEREAAGGALDKKLGGRAA